jgi:hypothetical protein
MDVPQIPWPCFIFSYSNHPSSNYCAECFVEKGLHLDICAEEEEEQKQIQAPKPVTLKQVNIVPSQW